LADLGPILIEAKYHKVWFDGLNNFYLREEDLDLRHAFRLPPNIHDGFETAEVVELKRLASDRKALGEQVEALFSRRRFRWLTRFANWPELKGLTERSRNKENDTEPASSKRQRRCLPKKTASLRDLGKEQFLFSIKRIFRPSPCKRNIEMTPLCKIEVTHPRVLGSREVRRGGVVDEQAGVQPS
jgi:hypothetical protein